MEVIPTCIKYTDMSTNKTGWGACMLNQIGENSKKYDKQILWIEILRSAKNAALFENRCLIQEWILGLLCAWSHRF